MSDTPIPVADEVDGPPADDELLRRRAIPEMPVAAAPAPVAAGRVIPPVDATTDLENRGLQSRTMGTPIPAAAAPMTPATPPQGSTADLEARSLATYEHPKSTPIQTGVASLWTKAENIHNPVLRVLGEIGAGGARALDAIGTGVGRVIPAVGAVESAIPGTTMNQEFGARRAAKQQEQGDISAQKEAQTEQEKAETGAVPARIALEEAQAEALKHPKQGLTPEETTIHDLMTGENGQPRVNPQTKQPYTYLDAYSAVEQAKQDTKPTPAATAAADKQANEAIAQKAAAAGFPLDDPKTLRKNLDAAVKAGAITKDDAAKLSGYQTLNATPGQNLTVRLEGEAQTNADAINKMFEGKEVLAHLPPDAAHPEGQRLLMSYADAKAQGIPPERLVALNAKEAQDTRDKITSTGATFRSLDTYRSDMKKAAPQLTEDDRRALQVLTSHEQVGEGFLDKIASGTLDTLFGQPLTGYSAKAMSGIMTKDQYDKLSKPAQKLVSDYFTAVIANFANMKNIMGSVGRNPMQLQAEINTIPLPYLGWDEASPAFDNKRDDIRTRAASQPQIYQPPSVVGARQQ